MIEFRCTGCYALLRTKEDAAGRPLACPKCGAALVAPAPEMRSAAPPPPPEPPSPWTAPPGELNPYQAPQTAEAAWQPPRQHNGMAVASVVLGATSLPAFCCCSLVGLPLSIAGLVTGIMGLKSPDRGLAVAGIVLSSLGLLLTAVSVAWLILSMAMQNQPMFR